MKPPAAPLATAAPASAEAPRPRRTLPLEARRHPFVATVDRLLRRRCGMTGSGPLVVGVSGGADSVALLVACVALHERARAPGRVVPIAAHVHHHLRGASADEDVRFVGRLCDRFDVELHVEHVDPKHGNENLATAARDLRYEALRRVAERTGAPFVAVAHHGDDQFETMLMSLCRGCGLDGLSGMSWSRDLGSGVRLLRPLLGVRRIDDERFCRAAGVEWRDDPTNADPAHARGHLRRDVIPALEELWPEAARHFAAAADALDVARRLVARELDDTFGPASRRCWPRDLLASTPEETTIAMGLRRAALDAAPACRDDFSRRLLTPAVDAIVSEESRPKRFTWPAGLVLEIDAREVRLVETTERQSG